MDNFLLKQLNLVKKMVKTQNFSVCLGITGRPRRGKSTLMGQMAYKLDETVLGDIDRCAFTIPQFKDAIMKAKGLGPGSVVAIDEGANLFGMSKNNTKVANQINELLMMNGKFNLIYLVCVPSIFDLNSFMRRYYMDWMVKVYLETKYDEVNDELEVKRGKFGAYSYQRKLWMLETSKFKYQENHVRPNFWGRFNRSPTPEEVWGEQYEVKKDAAIMELLKENKKSDPEKREKADAIKRLFKLRGKKLTTEGIASAFQYKSTRSLYNTVNEVEAEVVQH